MKTFNGIVMSIGMQKTVVVKVERQVVSPLYKKRLRKSKKYKADSGDFKVDIGEKVKIAETKPLSKDKHFRILKVIKEKTK